MNRLILLLTKFILNSRLRGTSRLVRFAARHAAALRRAPVGVLSRNLFLDLRLNSAHSLFLNPRRSEPELEILKKIVRPGDAAFDIGAHFGLYTIHLSVLVGDEGRVYAFEPNAQTLPALRATIRELPNAKLYELALSSEGKKESLAVPAGDATMASLKDWTEGRHGKIEFFECETAALDEIIERDRLPPPDFIKCDIEGGEHDCFRGAEKTLNRPRAPIILFEANRNSARGYGHSISRAFDFLASLEKAEYSFFLVNASAQLEKINSITVNHANILAVPKARTERLSRTDIARQQGV